MFDESSSRARHFVIRNTNSMSRQQDLADELRRSMHDRLVAQVRLRQRNIVFPDTVRNEGAFYRNLAGSSVHTFASHRAFAFLFGFFTLLQYLVIPVFVGAIKAIRSFEDLDWLTDLMWIVASALWIAVALKITINALVREDPRPSPRLLKTYPSVKI